MTRLLPLLLLILANPVFGQGAVPEGTTWFKWEATRPGGEGPQLEGVFRITIAAEDGNVRVDQLFEVYVGGEVMAAKFDFSTLCKADELLTPVSSTGTGGEDSPDMTWEWKVDGGKVVGAVTRPDGESRKFEIPISERTMTALNLFVVVEQRPFDAEDVLEFDSLEASEMSYKADHTLTYVGPEDVDGVSLHKFTRSGGGVGDFLLYLDDAHQVQRAVMDGRKVFTRLSAEDGEALLEKLRSQAGED